MAQLRLTIVFLVISFAGGCATLQATYDQSNQMFLEKTVQNLEINKAVGNVLAGEASVAIVSMERDASLDAPVVATIEDQLVSSLVEAGFTIYERDSHNIRHLMRETESGDRYSLLYPNPLHALTVSDVTRGQLDPLSEALTAQPTNLNAARYLLSYRILEVGLLYRENIDESSEVIREGRARLHVRVLDTKTGQIMFAGPVDGTFKDSIDKELVADLADYHYSLFPHRYPLQAEVESEPVRSVKAKSKQREPFAYVAPKAGFGLVFEEYFGMALGAQIGYDTAGYGRFFTDLQMVGGDDINLAWDVSYAYPIEIGSWFAVVPSFGLGLAVSYGLAFEATFHEHIAASLGLDVDFPSFIDDSPLASQLTVPFSLQIRF